VRRPRLEFRKIPVKTGLKKDLKTYALIYTNINLAKCS